MRIGLISDTHGYLDPRVLDYFADCDEIWHAGDIGTLAVADQLAAHKPLRAVYGNVDAPAIRYQHPEHQRFDCAGLSVWMTHIGGFPPRYHPSVLPALRRDPPRLFICGHSHVLRVMPDPNLPHLLYLNPGAAGQHGFHHVRTLLRFQVEAGKLSHVEAIELGKRGTIQ